MDRLEKEIIRKYGKKLDREIKIDEIDKPLGDYREFRKESFSRKRILYERLCRVFGNFLKIKPNAEDYNKLKKSIEITHLEITPEEAYSFGTFIDLGFIVFVIAISGLLFFTVGFDFSYFLIVLLLIIIAAFTLKPLTMIPRYLENKYRLRASNQMVLCILYVVMYMRHTSNLEHAVKFAAEHLDEPLSLDLKKVFWDIEIGKYSNLKESLDSYLERWRDSNLEFVEAFHLIEGSLYEHEENRRIGMLEKSLEIMLEGTHEKMLHYAQDLKNPITMIHMLGVILPILGLVILPLVGSLMGGSGFVKLLILGILYLIVLPLSVYFLGMGILSKRPTGYHEGNLIEKRFKKYENVSFHLGKTEIVIPAWIFAFFIFVFIALIGFVPLMMHYNNIDFQFLGGNFLDYKSENGLDCSGNDCYGPFGAGAVIFSLFLPLALALSLGLYFGIKSRRLVKMREETMKLEREFSGGLFQLGNRVGDGVPVEVAFSEVANTLEGTPTGSFFRIVAQRLLQQGLSLKEAMFGQDGAIWHYPSSLVESSMKVLLQAARKSPEAAAKSMTSISFYVNNIHSVNERLKDLLSDILSSMKSQISFLTPIIAGIVVGISAMIITVLSRLTSVFTATNQNIGEGFGNQGLQGLLQLFEIPSIIPGYYLQMIIGLYVVEIAIVLTILANGIENGQDKINERASLSKNLYITGILYFLVALIVTFIFTLLANSIKLGVV